MSCRKLKIHSNLGVILEVNGKENSRKDLAIALLNVLYKII